VEYGIVRKHISHSFNQAYRNHERGADISPKATADHPHIQHKTFLVLFKICGVKNKQETSKTPHNYKLLQHERRRWIFWVPVTGRNSQLILERRPSPTAQRKTKSPKCLWQTEQAKNSMIPYLVIKFEDKKTACWPCRAQCYQQHQATLLCMLSIPLLEEMKRTCAQKPSYTEKKEGKNNHLGSAV